MQPIPMKILYSLAYRDLKNIVPYNGERFVHALIKSGQYVNYAVSDFGRVYSFYRNCEMKQFVDDRGYHKLEIRTELNKTYYVGVHFLELMSFCPITNTDLYVPNHKDGNPGNNMLYNLEWMTVSENTRHALDTGLANYKGENNPRAILTNEIVHEICKLAELQTPKSEIGTIIMNRFNIPSNMRTKIMGAINHIVRGQTYLDISRQYNIIGIHGKVDYEPEITKTICDLLSERSYTVEELCDYFNIPLEDRKMFLNYVRDVTRRQKHTYITNKENYPVLHSVINTISDPSLYQWYYY